MENFRMKFKMENNYTLSDLKAIAKKNHIKYTNKTKSQLYNTLCNTGCVARPGVTPDYKPKTKYLRVEDTTREKCTKDWILAEQIGVGCCGSVQEVCKGENCNYVLKISPLKRSENAFEIFQRDVHFMSKLKKTGLVPNVIDSWVCQNSGFMIMDVYTGDLTDLLMEDENGQKCLFSPIFTNLVRLTDLISGKKIIHGDNKLDNYLYRFHGDEPLPELVLTDFGFASDFKKFDYKDFQMGFPNANHNCKSPVAFIKKFNLFVLLMDFIELEILIYDVESKKKMSPLDAISPQVFNIDDYNNFFKDYDCTSFS